MLDPPGRVLGGRTDDVLVYRDCEVLSEEGLDAAVALLVRVVERRLSEVILLVEVGAGTVLEEQTNERQFHIRMHRAYTFVIARIANCCAIVRTLQMNVGTSLQEQAR